VQDYRITYDQSSGEYTVIASGVNLRTYTATGLIAGHTYKFKVESRNIYGYSAYSELVSILCAASPSQPEAPTSIVEGNNVVFNWNAPIENGTPITGYHVYFRKADDTFETELINCDGSKSEIVITTQCTIPLETLSASPFGLSTLGLPINAKVSAYNAYGESLVSEVGGGAVI